MAIFTTAENEADLRGILRLQRANHPTAITDAELRSQGFVTVAHSYEQLERLNFIERHVIAKESGRVVGYVLAMTKVSRHDIPVLFSMFDAFDRIEYSGQVMNSYDYIIIGQVCVDKAYRGQSIIEGCYSLYRSLYKDKYAFATTEIAVTNPRSLRAHERIGFEIVASYTGPDGTDWNVVAWNWDPRSL